MTASGGLVAEHFILLQNVYGSAFLSSLPDGTTLVTVPSIVLPTGWNQPSTAVHFVVPIGYPLAKPDCFWADPALRLAGGGMPQNAGVNQLAGLPNSALWFSWHVITWNPSSDSLLTYVRVIQRRFVERR